MKENEDLTKRIMTGLWNAQRRNDNGATHHSVALINQLCGTSLSIQQLSTFEQLVMLREKLEKSISDIIFISQQQHIKRTNRLKQTIALFSNIRNSLASNDDRKSLKMSSKM